MVRKTKPIVRSARLA